MPTVRIHRLNSKLFTEVQYDQNNATLKSIMNKYDTNLNPENTRLSIGADIMIEWSLPVETCMFYGDFIQIYTFMITISVEFKGKAKRLEIDSRRSILILKSQIKQLFGVKICKQILVINEEIIIENIESMLYHNLSDNSHVIVKEADVDHTLPNKNIPIKFNGKPTDNSIVITTEDTIFTIREKIFDENINPEKYTIRVKDHMLEEFRQTRHGKKYPKISRDLEFIDLYPKHVQNDLVEVIKKPQSHKNLDHKLEHSHDQPQWRISHPGLCIEGTCQNPKCSAFETNVIINMGSPVIYKVSSTSNKLTICPICSSFVKPRQVFFNHTEWRFIGIKKTDSGLIKLKSDWKFSNTHTFDRLSEADLANWDNIVIETKSRMSALTAEFKCDACLSADQPIEAEEAFTDKKCRHEYYDEHFYSKQKAHDNFYKYNIENKS